MYICICYIHRYYYIYMLYIDTIQPRKNYIYMKVYKDTPKDKDYILTTVRMNQLRD